MSDRSGDLAGAMGASARSTEEQLSALWDLVQQQQRELGDLRSHLAQDRAGSDRASVVAPVATAAVATDSKADGDTQGWAARAMRRSLLKGVGAGAAAVMGAGLLAAGQQATGGTERAEAADLGNMIIGTTNLAKSTTQLNDDTGANADVLLSVDNSHSTSTLATAAGVKGQGPPDTIGVYGFDSAPSAMGFGVRGESDLGFGVVGISATGIDLAADGTGILLQRLQAGAGTPPGSFVIGEQARDANGEMFISVGPPLSTGSWSQVARIQSGFVGGAINFLASPYRLLDTRPGQPSATPSRNTPLPANTPVTVQVTGVTFSNESIPAGATGIIGNLTVTDQGGGINVRVFAGDLASAPLASSITAFPVTPFLANNVLTRLSSDGKIKMQADNFSVDVIFDITAFIM